MEPERFEGFIERLLERLRSDERVLGVVGLGSTALGDRPPDRWSDHDLWVVVADGAEEEFRRDPSWLPDAGRIVLWMRETPHGMKAVYDDAHLVEVAVFRVDELEVTRANDFRVFLDREKIAERMDDIRDTTASERRRDRTAFLAGQFLTNLLVGAGRHARGERLSGHDFVKGQGTGHLLELVAAVVPPQRSGALDELSPWRRFEEVYPAIAARVERALRLPVPEAALALIDLADVHVEPNMPDYPAAAAAVIATSIREMVAAGEWQGARFSPPPPSPIR